MSWTRESIAALVDRHYTNDLNRFAVARLAGLGRGERAEYRRAARICSWARLTVGQVVEADDADLLKLRGMGAERLAYLREMLGQ